MPAERVIRIERDGHVATVWLDRPDARNALGPPFFEQLPAAMEELSSDRDVRAVVVAANGAHFTVGLDLKAMGGLISGGGEGDGSSSPAGDGSRREPSMAAQAAGTRETVLRLQRSISSVADCPKPVIAAIHGYCIGGGVDLASACDVRLASADAVFSVRETRIAIVADLGSLQRLPLIIGKGHVAELAYTGKDISAERAKEIGLVNDVLSDAEGARKAAAEMASEIAANSPFAVQGTKAVLRACEGRSVEEGLDYVATWNAGFLRSEDLMEAMGAFLEKRSPRFEGR
ncbi:MAG TPA: crotonase/enoyl-CoA hydratase family protein [Acidimicrobiales bacterium]|nr:crotonase/enoyl-CoA hydratase family protein [Acidimicrobiales bacterium]